MRGATEHKQDSGATVLSALIVREQLVQREQLVSMGGAEEHVLRCVPILCRKFSALDPITLAL